MALSKYIKVPMPTKNIFVSSANTRDIPYVYYVSKSYRNEKGQPTCDRVSIGRKDSESDMLIPNDNFFEIFDCEIKITVKGLKNNE